MGRQACCSHTRAYASKSKSKAAERHKARWPSRHNACHDKSLLVRPKKRTGMTGRGLTMACAGKRDTASQDAHQVTTRRACAEQWCRLYLPYLRRRRRGFTCTTSCLSASPPSRLSAEASGSTCKAAMVFRFFSRIIARASPAPPLRASAAAPLLLPPRNEAPESLLLEPVFPLLALSPRFSTYLVLPCRRSASPKATPCRSLALWSTSRLALSPAAAADKLLAPCAYNEDRLHPI